MSASIERGASKEWVDFHKMDISLYREEGPLSDTIQSLKARAIEEAVEAADWGSVKEYCRNSHGLVYNSLRQRVWPALLGAVEMSASLQTLDLFNTNDLAEHKDEEQVLLDIKRSFTVTTHLHTFPQAGNSFATVFTPEDIEELRRRLFSLIVRVLRKYPCLHYYQGYHDVASVVLLVCYNPVTGQIDENLASSILERLTVLHLRDYMLPSIDLTINHLKVVAAILEEVDPTLFHLASVSSQSYLFTNGQYYDYKFIEPLSSILTIFSHDISNMNLLLPIWDFVLSYNSIAASLYVYAAALQHYKDSIVAKLELKDEDDITMYYIDPAQAHAALSASNLFENITCEDLSAILTKARKMIEAHPLSSLSNKENTTDVWFGQFNKKSVLATSSALGSQEEMQHLFDGDELTKLLQLQHEHQQAETKHASEVLTHHMEQAALADSLTTSDDERTSSRMSSLSSSLSSLSATSYSLNSTLVNKSSLFLKKIFSPSDDDNNNDSVAKRDRRNGLRHNLYKISVSVGFVGFLLHCLLRHSEMSVRTYSLGPFGSLNSISSSVESFLPETLNTVRHGVRDVAGTVTKGLGDVVNAGLDLTQIGIGTLRDSVFRF